MSKLTFWMLVLMLASLALSCSSGARSDDQALAVTGTAAQSSVGRAPHADDADCAEGCDMDCCEGDEDGDEHGDDDQEVAVALADVPRVVLEAARAAVPGVVLTSAEVEQEDGQTVYSLEGTIDGKEVEIEVSAAGKVLEIERD